MLKMIDKRVTIAGQERVFQVLPHPGATCILPWQDGKIALIRQFRPAVNSIIWEAPAGTLDPNEAPEDCARRELAEETGLRAERLVKLAAFFLAPGYSSEYLHVYAALDLTPGERNLDDGEEIEEPVWFTLDKAKEMVNNGEVKDAKTIIAICLAEQRLA